MSPAPRSVGVVAALHLDAAIEAAREAVGQLLAAGRQVRAPAALAERLNQPGLLVGEQLATDLLLVFGGDGTVISALREASCHGTPVIGVNFGTVGFLTEIEPDDLPRALAALLAGEFELEPRLMLQATVSGPAGEQSEIAANDVVVKATDPSHVVEFALDADGDNIALFPADGLIVATPTGSTAYSLSAGGPVLVPALPAYIVTPICPHTLAIRPLVLPAATPLTITVGEVGRRREVTVSVDGRATLELPRGARLTVTRATRQMILARLGPTPFFDSLRGKLRWGKPK